MLERAWRMLTIDVRRLVGKFAVHPVVLFPGLVLLSLGTAFADTQNLNRYNEQWVIVATHGFVGACVWFFAIGVLVRIASGYWRTVAVLFLYATTELVRTLIVENGALSRGMIGQVEWTAQVMTAILTGLTVYGVASLAVNDAYEFRATVADLKARSMLLETTLARTELDANIARREILRTAKTTIRSALKKTLGGSSTEATVRALLDVSDDVVRPLSRQLLFRPGTFAHVQPSPVRTQLHFWEVVNLASSTKPFRPGPTVFVGGMLALGSAVTAAPYGLGILAMLILLAFPYLLLTLADRFLTRRLRDWGSPLRFVTVCAIYSMTCGIDAVAVGLVNGLSQPLLSLFVLYATVMGALILWYIATMSGVRRGYNDVIQQLRAVNEQLEWAVARVNSRLWTDQKELSRILHNEVQGVLVATAFKLQREVDAGKEIEINESEIRASVFAALDSPNAPSTAPPLEEALVDERERWDGVLRTSWDIDSDAFERVDNDRDARRVIQDLVGEFLTNSVKHGKAHTAMIRMRNTERGTVDITLTNDGAPMPTNRIPGLGTELANSVSVSLRLVPRRTGVEIRLEIPCEGRNSLDKSADEPRSHSSRGRIS